MAERAPVFKPTPEQKLAIELEAPSVLVSASAGTGKTRTLVQRVLHFIAAGVPLERMLVITFTRKAAGELKERLYRAFDADPRLRPLRLALPQAYVTTIDGFCSRLLRENALAAGIDPGFGVLSDPDDRLAIDEILDAIFRHWYLGRAEDQPAEGAWADVPLRGSDAHHEFLRLIELCRMKQGREVLKQELEHLLALARVRPQPERFLERLESGLCAPEPPYVAPLASRLLEHWRAGVSAYNQMLEIAAAEFGLVKFAKHQDLARVLGVAPPPWPGRPGDANAAGSDLVPALAALHDHLRMAGVLTGRRPWEIKWPKLPGGTKPRLGALNELAKALLGHGSSGSSPFAWLPEDPTTIATQYASTRAALETLLALLRSLMERYETHKRERGLLDFADLEQETARLLRDGPRELLERFDLVFVDEFQDVNRLQAEIVDRLRPRRGRFLVGDVKQCIYQFRLAEPSIFRDRFRAARVLRPTDPGAPAHADTTPDEKLCVFLSENFRSRVPVLDAVNAIFEQLLWPEMIGGPYRDQALRPPGVERERPSSSEAVRGAARAAAAREDGVARTAAAREDGVACAATAREDGASPVEIHLFDKPPASPAAAAAPALEAEARFVARRIHELCAKGPRIPDGLGGRRSIHFGDIAVLLRSPGPTGSPFARILREEGVPVAFGGLDFFEREEVRDFLNMLALLDNAHNDVALAAVLRSPAVGFDDNDLLRVRLAWPDALALIAALRATASGRADAWSGTPGSPGVLSGAAGSDLARRCAQFIADLDRWRALVQAADLGTAVATVLDASGLLDAAAAQPGGSGRVGNLQQLLALVQRYCSERDHSLPGLVRYFENLRITGAGLEALPEERADQDAVRILSLHKAKGLEFPVVFVALQGRTFNLQDAGNKVLTGPDWIGVDAFDPETYVLTPTIAHRALAAERAQAVREEELRIFYVALTRAQEKLIVTGTLPRAWPDALAATLPGADMALRRHAALRARAALTWVVEALVHLAEPAQLAALEAAEASIEVRPGLILHRHDPARWLAPTPTQRPTPRAPEPEAERAAAPQAAVAERAEAALARLRAGLPDLAVRLARRYAHESALGWRGKYWVTEIKRLIDADLHAEEASEGAAIDWDAPQRDGDVAEGPRGAGSARDLAASMRPAGGPQDSERARAEGTWLHAVLEAVDPERADEGQVLAAASALARAGRVPQAWALPGNLAPVVDFFRSPLGLRMRAARADLIREAAFSLRLGPERLAEIWPRARELAPAEWLLIQGQIDALWRERDGAWVLVDFKSDRVAAEAEITRRAELYRPQIRLYREAAGALWGAGSIESWVYFLRPRRAVQVD